jgi:UDP-N-acetylglucosamine 2-epimerase (non-hydrolysing)
MNILVVAGTRPEIIKLAPVLLAARERSGVQADLVLTGQHTTMAEEAMRIFGLQASDNLSIMQPGQTPDHVFAAVLSGLAPLLARRRPDVVMVQGDTTSAVAAGLAAFHARIPVAHVEAGLRTHDLAAPFPEEANRRLLSVVTRYHLCPTPLAADNLRAEGIASGQIHVTGNTIVDAVRLIREKHTLDQPAHVHAEIRRPFVLVTAHRRESFGEGFRQICIALRECAESWPDLQFVYPVHLNPNVSGPVHAMLGAVPNIVLIPPVPYLPLLTLLSNAEFAITDSGGIQEEAPSFGTYCIVMRDKTERMESVSAGFSELVGTDPGKIVNAARRALDRGTIRGPLVNPYGDGRASERILDLLERGHGTA